MFSLYFSVPSCKGTIMLVAFGCLIIFSSCNVFNEWCHLTNVQMSKNQSLNSQIHRQIKGKEPSCKEVAFCADLLITYAINDPFYGDQVQKSLVVFYASTSCHVWSTF